jgi:sec-independent protein translocase protein TatB
MFDAGFLEIIVIAVIALVIVGPERLPSIARKVGGWLGKARALVNSTRSEIERELRTDEMRNMLIMQEEKIRDLQNSVQDSVDSASQHLNKQVTDEIAATENLLTPQQQSKSSNEDDTVKDVAEISNADVIQDKSEKHGKAAHSK